MTLFISNAQYLDAPQGLSDHPLIGYHSMLALDFISASVAVGDRIARNLWSPDTATFWQGVGLGCSIALQNPTRAKIDYVGIAKHNLGSQVISYAILKSLDDVTYTYISSFKTVPDDTAIMDYFDATTAPYLKIVFTSAVQGVTSIDPIIAHIRAGVALVLPQRMYEGHEPPIVRKVARIVNGSESGQYLGQIITRAWSDASCKQEHLTPQFVRAKIKPFINHCNGVAAVDDYTVKGAFFFAWRPLSYPNETVYGWVSDNIAPKNAMANGMMSFDFTMHGVA